MIEIQPSVKVAMLTRHSDWHTSTAWPLQRLLADRGILRRLMVLGMMALILSPAVAKQSSSNGPLNVIFDTDLCIDIDDGLALAMVHAAHDRHEINLVAVTVSLDEKWCAPYADVINTFYGHPDVPIGTIRNGLHLNEAWEKIVKGLKLPPAWQNQPDDNFVQIVLKRNNLDGSPIYPHRLTDGSKAPEAVSLLRKTLADQPDRSVVMIQVGNSANLAALLDSSPDTISGLSGINLIKRKVLFLSMMAGTFEDVKVTNDFTLPKGAGINIVEDVPSAQKIFDRWPTQIVISGDEIGGGIIFLGIGIERDFNYISNHPIADSYRYFCSVHRFAKCPHNNGTADPTATLYALRPDRNYFSLSNPGKVTVLPDGSVRFDEHRNGNQRYLVASEEQKVRVQEAIMMLVSQPPIN